ncbi:MAG: hypothetical protein H7346_06435 [Burkholderiaceae bacterium]|nr:hypothetical protein [Burkholderiaceae bacterium]
MNAAFGVDFLPGYLLVNDLARLAERKWKGLPMRSTNMMAFIARQLLMRGLFPADAAHAGSSSFHLLP